MQSRSSGWLMWVLWALTLLGLAATAWLDHLQRLAGQAELRPSHPVGWLLLGLGRGSSSYRDERNHCEPDVLHAIYGPAALSRPICRPNPSSGCPLGTVIDRWYPRVVAPSRIPDGIVWCIDVR